MRRMLAIIVIAVMLLIGLVGCTKNEGTNEFENYINNDYKEMTRLDNEMLMSYESVCENNYVSDEVMYKELTSKTIIIAGELIDRTVSISKEIKDAEILRIHKLYINYSYNMLRGITLMKTAFEKQDITLMIQAKQLVQEAKKSALAYKTNLLDLSEKNNVKITDL